MKLHILRDSGAVVVGKTTYAIPMGYTNEEVEAAVRRGKTDKAITATPYIVGRSK
jgi:hypothetical protein